jgi:membrane associated rhomboid family serine protease
MRLQYNSPVILTFTFICAIVLFLSDMTGKALMSMFTVYPTMDIANPLDYIRLFSHAMGHGDWNHLVGNLTYILLLGPILEEKYGSKSMLTMLFITAFVTGILNVLFFSHGLLGASGIVFMLILLSSVVNFKKGHIPITFILVVVLFLGKEIMNMFQNDSVSQSAHIIGGVCGSIFGFTHQKQG